MQLSALPPSTPAAPAAPPARPAPTRPDASEPAPATSGPETSPESARVTVPVSDVPEERFTQLVGFFHRNPGWIKAGPVGDALRGALDELPGVGGLVRDLTEPADVGYGQAIRDQTRWQIETGRQPHNPWWLRMNRQLVEDPLTAERAVRTGTVDQLTTPGQKAWAEYVRRSDRVLGAMGITPDAAAAAAERGEPVALGDAWKGVSPLKRAYVQLVLKPSARKALWVGHRKTLEDARPQAAEQAKAMHRRAPEEMSFSSSWATLIGYWSYLSPPVTGHQSKLAQRLILPNEQELDWSKLSWSEKAFTRLADWLDPLYEREIARPTDAEDAAAA